MLSLWKGNEGKRKSQCTASDGWKVLLGLQQMEGRSLQNRAEREGDKKEAVKEFMEKFQFNLEENCVSVAGFDLEDIEIDGQDVIEQMRNTFAELYGGND